MKRIYSSLIFLCLITFSVSAQEKVNTDAEAAPFLKITPDARFAGMGGIGTAMSTDASAFYHNAAASLFAGPKGAVAYSYTPWMRDLVSGSALHSVGGYYQISSKQSVVAGFRSFSHPDVDITDENGNVTNNFKPKEWALDLGYSYLLMKNLGMSLTLHYINSDMGSYGGADAGSAIAFDLGVFYRHSASIVDNANWAVGLQVANIGSKIKYLNTKYDLPGKINLGGSLHLPFSEKSILNCGLDLGYQIMPSGSSNFEAGIGAEYIFLKYAALRGGFHLGDKDKGNDSYGTLGCGVNYHHINADFSYLLAGSDCALKNTFRFTVGLDFGLFCPNK